MSSNLSSQYSIVSTEYGERKWTRCDYCHFEGLFANHLRETEECLQNYMRGGGFPASRSGDKEEFIVKATLLIKDCPVPDCLDKTGHRIIQGPCLDWWRQSGCKIMGFKGVDSNTSGTIIKEKISRFLKNQRRSTQLKTQATSQLSNQEVEQGGIDNYTDFQSQANNANVEGAPQSVNFCQFCSSTECLSAHLQKTLPCLQAYIRTYLPQRRNMYLDKLLLAICDLSILLSFCANSECSGMLLTERFTKHIAESVCHRFYKEEVLAVYRTDGRRGPQWGEITGPEGLLRKLSRRKNYLKTLLKSDAHSGIENYRLRLGDLCQHICAKCFVQGPLNKDEKVEMHSVGILDDAGEPKWFCSDCLAQNDENPLDYMITKMCHLGSPKVDFDDSLKPIHVRDTAAGTTRVVFLPASLTPSENSVTVDCIPCTATVLVPRQPEALDTAADEAMGRAFDVKSDLNSTLKFCSERPFFAPAQLTLSVAHRKKQADIRQQRLKMLNSLKTTSKGKIAPKSVPSTSSVVVLPHIIFCNPHLT